MSAASDADFFSPAVPATSHERLAKPFFRTLFAATGSESGFTSKSSTVDRYRFSKCLFRLLIELLVTVCSEVCPVKLFIDVVASVGISMQSAIYFKNLVAFFSASDIEAIMRLGKSICKNLTQLNRQTSRVTHVSHKVFFHAAAAASTSVTVLQISLSSFLFTRMHTVRIFLQRDLSPRVFHAACFSGRTTLSTTSSNICISPMERGVSGSRKSAIGHTEKNWHRHVIYSTSTWHRHALRFPFNAWIR